MTSDGTTSQNNEQRDGAELNARRDPPKSQIADNALLIASYNAVRAEIIERMKFRENIIALYLVGTLASLATSLSNFTEPRVAEGEQTPVAWLLLSCIMPLASLPVSAIVRQHHVAIRTLSKFIEQELAFPFIDGNVATFDRRDRDSQLERRSKGSAGFWGRLLGIHFMTCASILVCVTLTVRILISGEMLGIISIPAIAAAVVAINISLQDFRDFNKDENLNARRSG